MPFGKYRGQPVAEMRTTYLLWLLSQDHIRSKYGQVLRPAIETLRARFDKPDEAVAELTPAGPIPRYWDRDVSDLI